MSAPANQVETQLLVDVADGIATVTLNRPGQFNALSSASSASCSRRSTASPRIPACEWWCWPPAGADSAPATTSRRFGPWRASRRSSRSSRAAAG